MQQAFSFSKNPYQTENIRIALFLFSAIRSQRTQGTKLQGNLQDRNTNQYCKFSIQIGSIPRLIESKPIIQLLSSSDITSFLGQLLSLVEMKALIIVLLLAAIFAQPLVGTGSAFGRYRRCPRNCICAPNGACVSCSNQFYDPRTNCTGCKRGYQPSVRGCIPVNTPCPTECNCNGYSGSICTSCRDPNADPQSICKSCKAGYHNVDNTTCTTNNCPPQCQCRGYVPWVCTQCNDPRTDVGNNCLPVTPPFPPVGGCPTACICNGANPGECTRCKETHKTRESGCKSCEANYTLNGVGQCVWSLPWCAEHCLCDGFAPGCAHCKAGYIDTSKNCTVCDRGYKRAANADCLPVCLPNCECTTPGTCSNCIESIAILSTNCTQCQYPFKMNANGQCASG